MGEWKDLTFCLIIKKHFVTFQSNVLTYQNYFSPGEKIEFRAATALGLVLHTHSVAPHIPFRLCAATPSTLLYADTSKQQWEIHWLDLSELEPKQAAGKCVIHAANNTPTRDLCFTQNGDRQLLIVIYFDGIVAYNTETDKVEWEVHGTLPGMEQAMDPWGVTTDGRGHLFVGDFKNGNKSIQIFSVLDGHYLGCLMKDVDAYGAPARIRWCDSKSSLLAAFMWQGKWHLKVINVQF